MGGRADAEHAKEAWRGHYPPCLLHTRHESAATTAGRCSGLTARAQGREVGVVKKQRGHVVSASLSLFLHLCVSSLHSTLSHPRFECSRRVSVMPSASNHPRRGVGSPTWNIQSPLSDFTLCIPVASAVAHIHQTPFFFLSPVFSFVEIQEAVFPASLRNISGYSSARVLFCPRSAARHRLLFNLLPLMTVKQAKVQVPTLRETRINLQ